MPDAVDVAVIGGGPAGATVAGRLAARGARVTIVDRGSPAHPWSVETLPPGARPLLRELGAWPQIGQAGCWPAFANESAWGRGGIARSDFTCDPHGSGWYVDRRTFNASMLDRALGAGADVISAPVTDIVRDRGGWHVGTGAGDNRRHLRAGWLVDASGRRTVLSPRVGAPRQRLDSLIAILATFRRRDGADDQDRVTFVASAPDGWWYTAMAGGRDRLVAYFTDASDRSARAAVAPGGLRALWSQTPSLSRQLPPRDWRRRSGPTIRPAGTTRLAQPAGAGWLAVGDAALSVDPISSQGIMTAAYTGLRAAEAIGAGGPAVDDYADAVATVFDAYVRQRYACYVSEQRWADRPFWRRRHRRVDL